MTKATRVQSFLCGLALAAVSALALAGDAEPFYVPGTDRVLQVPTVSWEMVLDLTAKR